MLLIVHFLASVHLAKSKVATNSEERNVSVNLAIVMSEVMTIRSDGCL